MSSLPVDEPVLARASGPWPPDDLEPVAACPVCGAAERSLLWDGLTDRVFGAAPGTWKLMRCAGCASGYLDPRPTLDSIGRAYAVYYTHGGAEAAPRIALHDLRQALANDHLRARWGYDVTPATPAAATSPACCASAARPSTARSATFPPAPAAGCSTSAAAPGPPWPA